MSQIAFALSLLTLMSVSPLLAQKVQSPATFERLEDRVVAKLVPRVKNSQVAISFQVENGKLAEIAQYRGDLPGLGVSEKDLRTGLFSILIEVDQPGQETQLVLSSSFFTTGTSLVVYNPHLQKWWKHQTAAPATAGEVCLRVAVRDGSEMDGDGRPDGRIELVVGQYDSFWGYALGTLFIRFFGIFLVLSILMLGMMAAGKVFSWLEKPAQKSKAPEPVNVTSAAEPSLEEVAALALALHLHQRLQRTKTVPPADGGAWRQAGRLALMGNSFDNWSRVKRRVEGKR